MVFKHIRNTEKLPIKLVQKELVFIINKELLQLDKKKINNPKGKRTESLNRLFIKSKSK